MTRDDHILATVAAGMQDSEKVYDALSYAMSVARRKAGPDPMLIDIAHEIAAARSPDTDNSRRLRIAACLLETLDEYALAAITAEAESDTPQPDDEENE
jgi:hypothetical protein